MCSLNATKSFHEQNEVWQSTPHNQHPVKRPFAYYTIEGQQTLQSTRAWTFRFWRRKDQESVLDTIWCHCTHGIWAFWRKHFRFNTILFRVSKEGERWGEDVRSRKKPANILFSLYKAWQSQRQNINAKNFFICVAWMLTFFFFFAPIGFQIIS